ncbi:probable multidrug resistance-associated protein lethal(2)03659 isoform X2 [Leptinotarsa decemlineata]|uniref:probable multidrug resistance-associated protein lethal(2)03659 isoform X2 n=1 Tax=Leptinotarsa decemlineata TaxID=7539 RepID=UPI003D306235
MVNSAVKTWWRMDHCEKLKRKTNPRETANICSLLTFSYVVSLFKKSFKHDLEEEDLYEVLSRCGSKRCGDKIEDKWRDETKNNNEASLAKMVWKRFGWRYMRICTINICWKIFRTICEPYVITNLISYFKPGQTEMTIYDAYFYAVMMISLKLCQRLYLHNYILCVQQLGVEIKTSFTSLLYRKSLKLTSSTLSQTTVGNIVTLITKDVQTFKESVWIISDVSSGLVQISLISYLIFAKVGITSLFGIGILIAALPIQAIIGRWINTLRQKTGAKTDERLQVTQEALSAIRIIKMYTWEKIFGDRINEARQKEVNKMLLGFYLRAILLLIGVLSSNFGLYILITSHIWMGFPTDTTMVFYLLTNFKTLRKILGNDIPWNIGRFAELVSAATRINKIIRAEEFHPYTFKDAAECNPFLELLEVTVEMGNEIILSDVSLKLDSGLTVVTGPVGSGKSSLLKVILQDYPLTGGKINLNGCISYASQEPWLFPSTIRQNIIFGETFDAKKYNEVIRVCALQVDFNLLEKSDDTIVIDGGLNLSKGQRTRINLARAVYKNSDIYLLDDSLTDLDGRVQDYIFKECIRTYLKGKICVLVSQAPNHINEADTVVMVNEGRIKYSGKPTRIILQEVEKIVFEKEIGEEVVADYDESEENERLIDKEETKNNRMYKEVKEEGKVNLRVYHKYLIFGGGFIVLIINLALGGLAQTSESYSDKLLTRWVDEKQEVLNMKEDFIQHQTLLPRDSTVPNIVFNQTILLEAESKERRTFTTYSIMLLVATVLILITTYANFDFCRRSSINIHKAVVASITKATMSFFDTHFIGNVLNRFSEDLAQIDENLPFIFRECLKVMFSTIGQIGLVLTVDKSFILFIIIVFMILIFLGRIYMPAGRSLKRLEASCLKNK